MPGAINGAIAYAELKASQRYAFNNKVRENTPGSLKGRAWIFLGHGPETVSTLMRTAPANMRMVRHSIVVF